MVTQRGKSVKAGMEKTPNVTLTAASLASRMKEKNARKFNLEKVFSMLATAVKPGPFPTTY